MPGKTVTPMPDTKGQTDGARGNTASFPTPGMNINRVGPATATPNDATISGLERRAPGSGPRNSK